MITIKIIKKLFQKFYYKMVDNHLIFIFIIIKLLLTKYLILLGNDEIFLYIKKKNKLIRQILSRKI